jgi:hypothetical protein
MINTEKKRNHFFKSSLSRAHGRTHAHAYATDAPTSPASMARLAAARAASMNLASSSEKALIGTACSRAAAAAMEQWVFQEGDGARFVQIEASPLGAPSL